MTDRKKPGWAFWATVVISMPVLYLLSFGPACWLAHRDAIPIRLSAVAYRPLVSAVFDGPDAIRPILRAYAELFAPPNIKAAQFGTIQVEQIGVLEMMRIFGRH